MPSCEALLVEFHFIPKSMRMPDAAHAGLADPRRRRHRARRPVGGVDRLLMKGHLHYPLHLLLGDSARLGRPRRVLLESRDAACQEATAPTRCLFLSQVHPSGNLLVFHTIGGQQHDARPFHQSRRHGAGPRRPLQGLSLFRVQNNRQSNPPTSYS